MVELKCSPGTSWFLLTKVVATPVRPHRPSEQLISNFWHNLTTNRQVTWIDPDSCPALIRTSGEEPWHHFSKILDELRNYATAGRVLGRVGRDSLDFSLACVPHGQFCCARARTITRIEGEEVHIDPRHSGAAEK